MSMRDGWRSYGELLINFQLPTSNAQTQHQRPTPNAQRPTPNAQRPTPKAQSRMNTNPLRTTVIGSYPFPGWLELAAEHLESILEPPTLLKRRTMRWCVRCTIRGRLVWMS